jgi:hypothetical protein
MMHFMTGALLQITVQLKFLSLAGDLHRVLTKISDKLQKSFLAVEMVKMY